MSALTRGALLVAGAAAAAVSAACSAAPGEGDHGVSRDDALSPTGLLTHLPSGLCVAAQNGSSANGAAIVLAACDGSAAQEWTYSGGSLVGIGGKCLDVQWANTANGTPVQLWDCNGTPAQQWTMQNNQLVGIANMRLDVPGGQDDPGQTLWIWQENDGPNQQFHFGASGCGSSGSSGGGSGSSSGSTGGGGSSGGMAGVPGDASGTPAMRIADMMEIFGANIFSNGQDGQAGETVAGVTSAAQYLLGNSGLKMLFRGYVNSASDYATFGPQLFTATGCKMTLCMGIGDTPDPSGVISLAQASASQGGWVQFIEGGNEPNTDFGAPYQTGVAPDAELGALQKIYAAVHPLGIPVAAPSVVGDYAGIAGYWGADLSAAVAATDLYDTHLYPNNGGPNGADQMHDWTAAVSQSDWGGKGGIVTEWQPVLYNQHATDDATAAYWSPIALLSGHVDFHLQALVWWEMFDYPGFNPHVGLFNGTAGSPYPAANALRAMYTLTGDTGAAKHTFTPGKLDVTVTGLPAGDNQYGGGRWAVFQNSSPGTFFLFVWNEQDALATGSTTPVTVTFNEGPMAEVIDYSLTNPASANPAPVQTLTNATSVHLDLTTEVRLLQITHP